MSHIWETDSDNSPRPQGSGWGGLVAAVITLAIILLLSAYVTGAPVNLRWDANPEQDIAGYRLYWGTESGFYEDSIVVQDTHYGVENLTAGTRYYFAVQAINTDGVTSEMSDEVSYVVPTPPPPVPQIVKVRLWRSENLIDKTTVAEFYFPKKASEFFGLAIETP